MRRLEIGPVPQRIEGFETLNVVGAPQVDEVVDATRTLPFPDGSFDPISASHVLEHVPWYQTVRTLRLWRDKLKPGGRLEVWGGRRAEGRRPSSTPSGAAAMRRARTAGGAPTTSTIPACGSRPHLSCGDGQGTPGHFNWHMAAFSKRRLAAAMREAGLREVTRMERSEVRGYDHGWIDLGVKGLR